MAGCEGRRPTAAAAMETSLRIQISAVIQRESLHDAVRRFGIAFLPLRRQPSRLCDVL